MRSTSVSQVSQQFFAYRWRRAEARPSCAVIGRPDRKEVGAELVVQLAREILTLLVLYADDRARARLPVFGRSCARASPASRLSLRQMSEISGGPFSGTTTS